LVDEMVPQTRTCRYGEFVVSQEESKELVQVLCQFVPSGDNEDQIEETDP
jgi:hypothetical protein